jgi:hypothetical protein
MMWCTRFSETPDRGWWYTWTGSHLIRDPLRTSGLKKGAAGAVITVKIKSRGRKARPNTAVRKAEMAATPVGYSR